MHMMQFGAEVHTCALNIHVSGASQVISSSVLTLTVGTVLARRVLPAGGHCQPGDPGSCTRGCPVLSANVCFPLISPPAPQLCQPTPATFIEVETMVSPPPCELDIFIFRVLS